jgi:L-alanine-DL-glutamate epimerase-like enolase superfamily enzyme
MPKITAINVYQIDLPLKEGRYSWADGKYVEVFDSTIVEIETDSGICGIGEVCPLGPFYLPAYGPGVRTGIAELAPHLLGEDATAILRINDVMDQALLGHPYVKSPIDMACWDILGQVSGQSVCSLLGGKDGDAVDLYRAISQRPPDEMADNVCKYREEGYTKFQLKVGGNAEDDIDRSIATRSVLDKNEVLVADANTGWKVTDARRVVHAIRELDIYIEQPCANYEHCLSIRRGTPLPFILDENIDGLTMFLRAYSDKAMDAINLKISKVGGLTKARQLRDLCVALGIPMTVEDSWGGDVTTAAIAHLAHSTAKSMRFSSTDFNSYVTVSVAENPPQRVNGKISASDDPGLGIVLDKKRLGKPVAIFK